MLSGYDDEFATLGDRIATQREALGFSPAQLAERIGVTTETVEEWEFDQSAPRANRMQMLAGVLNVSLVWLMTGQNETTDDEDDDDDHGMETMLQALRQLRADQVRLAERTGRLEKKLRALLGK